MKLSLRQCDVKHNHWFLLLFINYYYIIIIIHKILSGPFLWNGLLNPCLPARQNLISTLGLGVLSGGSHNILISLPEFNLPLIGSFTWLTPPGPYRTTTCRGRELNFGSHTSFFEHTKTWTTSPDEGLAQCRGHLRDSTIMKDDTHQARTYWLFQDQY